ncbi:hypothetical protein I3843_09G064100 [Carya illinoinensis]|uniref:Uncharacterized protein n=1 Tax=Carya illinoinensis TaxID=32201 RepID=A0A8T1PEK9_CARIL|nr:hypothetical protein CIPAW_09G063900 [Carya illinoinensis]KAG6694741.1 hypothetical protein I3842_09G063900 [Carya illinoinensis]KAG7962383.1 hypothetical protein I3843_09G064100 [Carya illinoinensis]KAG7962384.1 hypothetical protein I3843_09G064100 [Carya illinoinensis]
MLAAIADSSLCRPSINVQLRFFLPIVSLFATHCNSHRLISVMTRPAEENTGWMCSIDFGEKHKLRDASSINWRETCSIPCNIVFSS